MGIIAELRCTSYQRFDAFLPFFIELLPPGNWDWAFLGIVHWSSTKCSIYMGFQPFLAGPDGNLENGLTALYW